MAMRKRRATINDPISPVAVLYPPKCMTKELIRAPVLELRKAVGLVRRAQPERIAYVLWMIPHVSIEVDITASKPDRVLADESSSAEIVVAFAVVVESGFWIGLARGVLEEIGESARGGRQLSKRIERVRIGQSTSSVAQRCNRT